MDGKHICTGTNRNGRYYFNFKKFFSIVLFVVVDANKNFSRQTVDLKDLFLMQV
jgi:hypothetical protein